MIVNVNADTRGRVFYGIGGVTSNGMTKLLKEYPKEQREDILDLLFLPQYGAGMQVLKVEIGSDANGTCGTEPSHMRSEDDFDITRGVGLWMAQEAKKRNPSIILDAIRWGTPGWVTDHEKKYKYYRSFLEGAREVYGLHFDYLAPDENEGPFHRNWVVNVLRPGLNRDGFEDVKLSGADSNTDWNIAARVENDPELKKALAVLNIHYKQDSPLAAKESGLLLFDSEDLVAYRHDFSFSLDMAQNIIRAYASGRIVQYQIHPIIEAIYDNLPYTCKSLLTAACPWSGFYQIEYAFWVIAQFTQFIFPGWRYVDSGCCYGQEQSCLSLMDEKGQVSVVLLNRSDSPHIFEIQFQQIEVEKLHRFQTTQAESFVKLQDISVAEGCALVELPPRAICTLTTTTGQRKGKPRHEIPERKGFVLPYEDSFGEYVAGKQPRYTVDQAGAFEIQYDENGQKCLEQVITPMRKPFDWSGRPSPQPYTVLGGQNLANYRVSLDFRIQEEPGACEDAYVILGARCNFSPKIASPAECYGLVIFVQGNWQLCCGSFILACGIMPRADMSKWHSIAIEVVDDRISAYFDDCLLVECRDSERSSGNVVIGSGYHEAFYRNLRIEPIASVKAVECVRYSARDSHIRYSENWALSGNDARNYMRTLLTSDKEGESLEFTFEGTGVALLGMTDKDSGMAEIWIDGVSYGKIDTFSEDVRYRRTQFCAYRLPDRRHTLRLRVCGKKNFDAGHCFIRIDAVEIIGKGMIQ